jgi:hypothetical protein
VCGAAVQNIGVSVNSYVLLAFAAVLGAGILIFFLVICCMCSRIRLAVQLTKEAAKVCSPLPLLASASPSADARCRLRAPCRRCSSSPS